MNAAVGFAHEPRETVAARPDIQDLFTTQVAFVWRSLRHFGVREADLEDQTQEVFVIAHRRYATWDGEHPRAWLYAIARRCSAAYRRRAHRRHELPVDVIPDSPSSSDPAAGLELDRLDRALAAVDEDKRTVFVLFEIEEMSMRDVAQTVGCPVQTAYARLYAARRELASLLEDER